MTFQAVAGGLKDELVEIISNGKEVNDYELIVFKYVFISELKIPVHEELGIEITEDSFILYVIPDDLQFNVLRNLVDSFEEFEVTFLPNPYCLIKLKFKLTKKS